MSEFYSVMTFDARDGSRLRKLANTVTFNRTSAWGGLTIWARMPPPDDTTAHPAECPLPSSAWIPACFVHFSQTGIYEANPLLVTQVLTPIFRYGPAGSTAPPEVVGGVGVLTSWMEARRPTELAWLHAPLSSRHRRSRQPSYLTSP